MKRHIKLLCPALAVILLFTACNLSAKPSMYIVPSTSLSLQPSPTVTPDAAPAGEGVSVFYSEAWSGMLASLILMGRQTDSGWEDWILGSSTEDGRPITLYDAADISGDMPVLCKTPQVSVKDQLFLYTPDGYFGSCGVSEIYFRNWSSSGISSIYLSTENLGLPGEVPVLGFSADSPGREIVPMIFDGDIGLLEADFDGDGNLEQIEFEYIESAQVIRRAFIKDGVRNELGRLPCRDFSAMYACAVNIDGGDTYHLFERNTDASLGYFAFSGWQNGSLEILMNMDL